MNETVPPTVMPPPPPRDQDTSKEKTSNSWKKKAKRGRVINMNNLQIDKYSERKDHMIRMPPLSPFPKHYSMMNEFHRFIAHEDFERFLLIASKVKLVRQALVTGSIPSKPCVLTLNHSKHDINSAEVSNTARFIQTTLIPSPVENNNSFSLYSISRGTYQSTDSLINEAINAMIKEYDRCMLWYSAKQHRLKHEPLVNHPRKTKRVKTESPKALSKTSSDAIAVKYSKRQTDILTNWMIDNKSHPFPNCSEIEQLSKEAGLTYSQIVNWTTNVRKRNLKATVQGGKKPHHFLDFLFLADNRDKKGMFQLKDNGGSCPIIKKERTSSKPHRRKKNKTPKANLSLNLKYNGTHSATNVSSDSYNPRTSIARYNKITDTREKKKGAKVNPTLMDVKLEARDTGITKSASHYTEDTRTPPISHNYPQSAFRNIASTMTNNMPYNNSGLHQYYYTPEVPHLPHYAPGYCPQNHISSAPPAYFQNYNFNHPGEHMITAVSPLHSPDRWKSDAPMVCTHNLSKRNNSDVKEKKKAVAKDDKTFITDQMREDDLGKNGKGDAINEIDKKTILEYTRGGIVSTPPRMEEEQDELWYGSGFEGDFDDLSVSIDDALHENKVYDIDPLDVELVTENGGKESKKCSFTEADISNLCRNLEGPDDEEFNELFDLDKLGAVVAL